MDTCAHTFSPPCCFFIVPPVTLSYSFNLSLEPADSPVCVCTASGTMPKSPTVTVIRFLWPPFTRQLNIKKGRVRERKGRKRGCMVDAVAQFLWWRILLTCQGHVPHVDSRQVSDREGNVSHDRKERGKMRGQAQCDCLVLWQDVPRRT